MNCIRNKLHTPHSSHGFTLFYALLVTSLLLALGLAVFNITLKELMLSSDARESQNAFFAADAALECALYWDRGAMPAFGFYGDSLASGLAGFWRMEQEADDTIAYDYSGNGNYGTLTNSDGSGPTWTSGHSGEGLSFDGLNDHVIVPDDPSLSFATDEVTVSAWIYMPVLPANQRTIIRKNTQWSLGVFPLLGKIRALIQTTGGQGWNGTTMDLPYTFTAGLWYHLAFTYDGSQVQYYVNGSAVPGGSRAVTGTIVDNSNSVYIGASENSGSLSAYFSGTIDDVRVYTKALSPDEIDALYDSRSVNQFVPPVAQNSGSVYCGGYDMTNPGTGWNSSEGWEVEEAAEAATTTFDMDFNGRCASVVVAKDTSTTTIVSRGYNTCLLNDSRRVERALRAEY